MVARRAWRDLLAVLIFGFLDVERPHDMCSVDIQQIVRNMHSSTRSSAESECIMTLIVSFGVKDFERAVVVQEAFRSKRVHVGEGINTAID